MRVLIAPDSFKESLSAPEVCRAIAEGWRRGWAASQVETCPLSDGGDGLMAAVLAGVAGERRRLRVTGPLGEPVEAEWALTVDGTAVIEMAAASGLALVPMDRRDPLATTTFGTGELVRAALDAEPRRIVVGIGGSATVDGGLGFAQAIGVVFRDVNGDRIDASATGAALSRVAAIDVDGRDGRIGRVPIIVASDVDNPLCGERGAAAVYGPQKGATPDAVGQLEDGLRHLASVIERDLGKSVADVAGAGAAGGLGAGLVAFADASIESGIDLVMDVVGLSAKVARADLVITGEGRLDRQSAMGKVIAGVSRAARSADKPVIALVGSVGEGVDELGDLLDAYWAVVDRPMALEDALVEAPALLQVSACQVARFLHCFYMSAS